MVRPVHWTVHIPGPKGGRLSNPQSLNLYIYVLNSPVGYTDPTGLRECGYWDLVCKASNLGESIVSGTTTVVNSVVNAWNSLDEDTKTIIVAVAITAVIIATGGVAAPILVGAAIGFGVSGAMYTVAHNPADANSGFSLKGFFAAATTGMMFGALGGAAGPIGGTIASKLHAPVSGALARALGYGVQGGVTATFDVLRGADSNTLITDTAVGLIGFGATSKVWPTGAKSLAQLSAQSANLNWKWALYAPIPSNPTRGQLAKAATWGTFYPALAAEGFMLWFDEVRNVFDF